jgi:hypothetical protein
MADYGRFFPDPYIWYVIPLSEPHPSSQSSPAFTSPLGWAHGAPEHSLPGPLPARASAVTLEASSRVPELIAVGFASKPGASWPAPATPA